MAGVDGDLLEDVFGDGLLLPLVADRVQGLGVGHGPDAQEVDEPVFQLLLWSYPA